MVMKLPITGYSEVTQLQSVTSFYESSFYI